MTKTIVLGAGLSGLTAARDLVENGHDVTIVDKGRSVGGRLATRRIGRARFDHGAQFFTTRGDGFKATVADAVADGVVVEWCRGFGVEDGYPRYCGATGMSDFAEWMARDLDIRFDCEVDRIEIVDDQVVFTSVSGAVVAEGDAAIVTAPIPQMHRLLERGGLLRLADDDVSSALAITDYFATMALLVVVDGQPDVAAPGGMQFESGPFTFVADNAAKGISPVPALTFHADHDYSRRRFDDDTDAVVADLLALAQPWIGEATVLEVQLERWRYAGPMTPLPQPTVALRERGITVALAGDAFAGPKVEGAFNSGRAAAAAILTG